MVRAIVGTMINIGTEKITLSDFEKIIESKSRSKAGFSVPAHGLYLTKIKYNYIAESNQQSAVSNTDLTTKKTES